MTSLVTKAAARVRRLIWPPRPTVLPARPWFDEPDAPSQVTRRATNDDDRRVLESWVREGYAVVEGLVPHDLVDEMVADLDRVFTEADITDETIVNDLVLAGHHRPTVTGAELKRLTVDERVMARDSSNWRIHGFYERSGAADRIRELPELRRVASMILGLDAHAHYSINFHNGSTQKLHEDSAVFHLGVPNMICGAWIACEDIDEGAGPLVYHPGSHRRATFHGFDRYPMTNLRTAGPDVAAAYQHHVDSAAEASEPHHFLARKGDVLLWHGMLIHGGSAITTPGLTRRSYVLHYIPSGADAAEQVTGPTNW